jgi:hypothetical protein
LRTRTEHHGLAITLSSARSNEVPVQHFPPQPGVKAPPAADRLDKSRLRHDEVKSWVAIWGSANELPRPAPRRIG